MKYKISADQLYKEMSSWIEQNKRLANNELISPETRNFHYQIAAYQKELLARLIEEI